MLSATHSTDKLEFNGVMAMAYSTYDTNEHFLNYLIDNDMITNGIIGVSLNTKETSSLLFGAYDSTIVKKSDKIKWFPLDESDPQWEFPVANLKLGDLDVSSIVMKIMTGTPRMTIPLLKYNTLINTILEAASCNDDYTECYMSEIKYLSLPKLIFTLDDGTELKFDYRFYTELEGTYTTLRYCYYDGCYYSTYV